MSEVQSTVEYRDIQGFSGYRVGSDGTMWSCRKPVRIKGTVGIKTVLSETWKLLKARPMRSGHLRVRLFRDKKEFNIFVHRLVLETFVGPCPQGFQSCHFPDSNPANNNLSNLRWDTPLANKHDSIIHGTHAHGITNGRAKLTDNQITDIRRQYKGGNTTHRKLASQYGVSHAAIGRLLRITTWRHIK